jgi:hypothetical protein
VYVAILVMLLALLFGIAVKKSVMTGFKYASTLDY